MEESVADMVARIMGPSASVNRAQLVGEINHRIERKVAEAADDAPLTRKQEVYLTILNGLLSTNRVHDGVHQDAARMTDLAYRRMEKL